MEYPEWVERYGVGDANLDSYHHIFYQAVEQMDARAAIGDLSAAMERMAFLLMYCAMHFSEEEGVLHRAGYPDLEYHRSIHQRFHRRMMTLHAELERNPSPALARQTVIETREWWINHIQKEDAKFIPYLKPQE